jgi:translation initiation factor eIF-2B subunit gamma
MSDDLVIDVPFLKVANIHRSHNAAVTMILKQQIKHEGEEAKEAKSSEQTDYFGLVDYAPHITSTFTDTKHAASTKSAVSKYPCRVAYFSPSSEVEKTLPLRRSFLRKWPNVLVSKSYADSHLYVFSKWVMDLIVAQKEMKSLRHEILPYLIDTQRIVKRKLQKTLKEANFRTLTDYLNEGEECEVLPGVNLKSLLRTQQAAFDMSSFSHDQLDLVRCHAYIFQSTKSGAKQTSEEQQYAKRATNLATYLEVNRDLVKKGDIKLYESILTKQGADDIEIGMSSTPSITTPTTLEGSILSSGDVSEDVQIGADCVVGFGLQFTGPPASQGPRRVSSTLKRSNIGGMCKIGANVKIVGSVIMNHVTIGDK